jgi:hypothetical protein
MKSYFKLLLIIWTNFIKFNQNISMENTLTNMGRLAIETGIIQEMPHNSIEYYGQLSEENTINDGEKNNNAHNKNTLMYSQQKRQKLNDEDKKKLKDLLKYEYLKKNESLSISFLETSEIFSINRNNTIFNDIFASNKMIKCSLSVIYQDRLNSIISFLDNFELSQSKEIDLNFKKTHIESFLKKIKTYSMLSEQFEHLNQKERSNKRFPLKVQELQKNIEIILILQLEAEQIIKIKQKINSELQALVQKKIDINNIVLDLTNKNNQIQKVKIEKQNLNTEKQILLNKLMVFEENINNLLDQLTFQEPKEKLFYIGNAEKNAIIERSEEMEQTLILFEKLNNKLQTLYQNIEIFKENKKFSEDNKKLCIDLLKSFLESELLINITELINELLNNSFFKDSINPSHIISFYFTENNEIQSQIKKIFQFGIDGLKTLQDFKNEIENLKIFIINRILNPKSQYSVLREIMVMKTCIIGRETLELLIKIEKLKNK